MDTHVTEQMAVIINDVMIPHNPLLRISWHRQLAKVDSSETALGSMIM